jgi:hypothetical protein
MFPTSILHKKITKRSKTIVLDSPMIEKDSSSLDEKGDRAN